MPIFTSTVSGSSYTSSLSNAVGYLGTSSIAIRAVSSEGVTVLTGGSTTAEGSYTGSLFGTASYALNAASTTGTVTSVASGDGLTGGPITSTGTLNVGAGDGISVTADAVAVDGTVVRTSGNQTISGTKTFGNTPTINNSSPTVTFQDTDNRSAMVHVNSNLFYVLRGDGTNSTGWAQFGGYWPLTIDLENNNAVFGGTLTSSGSLSAGTGTIGLGGVTLASYSTTNYHQLHRRDGGVGIYLGGADAANYYDNTGHFFRDRSAGVKLSIDSSGNIEFPGGSRPFRYEPANGLLTIKGDTGGWAMGSHFRGSSNTDRGGFGAYGSTDSLNWYYIGPAYNAATMYILSGSTFSTVGIGTSTFTYSTTNRGTLEINGADNAIVALKIANSAAGYMYADATDLSIVGVSRAITMTTSAAHALKLGTNSATRVTIDSAGNVGIGNTGPSRLLQVGAITLSPSPDTDADITSAGGIIIASGKWLSFDGAYANHSRIRYNSANVPSEIAMEIDSYYGINFQTRGGSSRMVLLGNNGNVGIGTASPVAPLHVQGSSVYLSSTSDYAAGSVGSSLIIARGAATGNTYSSIYGVQNGGNAYAALVVPGGNVGIGTTSPGAKLSVVGGVESNSTAQTIGMTGTGGANSDAYNWAITSQDDTNWGFRVSNKTSGQYFTDVLGAWSQNAVGAFRVINKNSGAETVLLYVSGSGNVGIGTTTPAQKLHVVGDINATTGFRINDGATSGTYLRGNGTRFVGTTFDAGDIAGGTIPSGILGNSFLYVGTTQIFLNRGTGAQTLTGTSIDGNAGTATTATNLSTNRTNWSTNGTISAVVGQLSWKHYGNNHTIIDASNSTAPDGSTISNSAAANVWSATYPTLMGWNGSSTYGVRVDSARVSDNTTGTAANITAYTINQNLGTANSPTFADLYVNAWFRNNTTNTGLYNQVTTQHLSSQTNGYWDMSSTTTVSGIRFYTGGHVTDLRGYVYADNSNNIGFLNNGGSWRLRIVGADYTQIDGSSIRAPLFYDSNDTTYYLDPNSTAATAGRIRGGIVFGPNTTWSKYLQIGGNSREYVDNADYASVATSNGNLHIDAASGTETYLNYYDGVKIVFGSGAGSSWGEYTGGIFYAFSQVRGTIFYDYSDTSYYLDPNSSVSANLRGNLQFADYGAGVVGLYNSTLYQAVFAMGPAYVLPIGGGNTGTLYGIAWSYPSAGGAAANLASHGMLILENGAFQGAWGGGSLRTPSDVRGTLFYDWNNTNFYVDPNDTSVVNAIGASTIYPASLGSTYNFQAGSWGFRHQTPSGYIEFGPANSSYGHIYTDRGAFYMNAALYINGDSLINTSDIRSKIFYDVENTGYYFDGAGTGDSIRVAGNIVAYYSDERLKDIHGNIENALEKVLSLNGFYYSPNDIAQKLGYKNKIEVGVSAQQVELILPQIISEAPISSQYKTLDYSRLVPLLIEAIKEQQRQIEGLQHRLDGKPQTEPV